MYERSAIVLERYFNTLFGLNKKTNIYDCYKSFKDIIEEIEKYQVDVNDESKALDEYEDISRKIERIQNRQEKISREIIKLEEERKILFENISDISSNVERKLIKIEDNISKNNNELKELRITYIEYLGEYWKKLETKEKHINIKRETEENYFTIVNNATENIDNIDEFVIS